MALLYESKKMIQPSKKLGIIDPKHCYFHRIANNIYAYSNMHIYYGSTEFF